MLFLGAPRQVQSVFSSFCFLLKSFHDFDETLEIPLSITSKNAKQCETSRVEEQQKVKKENCQPGPGAGELSPPRKAERRPEYGERPPWPVGPSQTVRQTDRCRGRSPSCFRRHRLHFRPRRHLRPCTASRRPLAPTDLGNPGCTVNFQSREKIHQLNISDDKCDDKVPAIMGGPI